MPVGEGFIPAQIGENKKMTEHKKLQPEIRFAGFTDDWEQRKLGDVVERITRKNLNLESLLPLTISAQDGLISQTEFFDKQVASKNISGYYLIENGEFAYNKSYSNGYPWGAIKRLDKYKNGVLSTLYIVFKPIDVDSQFLVSYFDTTFWHSEIAEIAVEGARNHGLLNIPVMDFFGIKIKVPKSKGEQTQIGNFFKQLDDTIALHQGTLEKYQKLKVSYLEKMFPKENKRYPELRFPNFTDAWEQRKLGECFNEITERSSIGELISVTMNSGVIKASDLDRKDNSSKDKSNYKKVEIGDIAYNSMRMWQGSSGESTFRGILSPAYTVLIPNKDISSTFFSYYFKLERMLEIFKVNSQGLTSDTWNLKYPTIAKIVVSVPTLKEQIQIGNFFKQLDDTIALHQKELAKYQQIKAACLEKMFVE